MGNSFFILLWDTDLIGYWGGTPIQLPYNSGWMMIEFEVQVGETATQC